MTQSEWATATSRCANTHRVPDVNGDGLEGPNNKPVLKRQSEGIRELFRCIPELCSGADAENAAGGVHVSHGGCVSKTRGRCRHGVGFVEQKNTRKKLGIGGEGGGNGQGEHATPRHATDTGTGTGTGTGTATATGASAKTKTKTNTTRNANETNRRDDDDTAELAKRNATTRQEWRKVEPSSLDAARPPSTLFRVWPRLSTHVCVLVVTTPQAIFTTLLLNHQPARTVESRFRIARTLSASPQQTQKSSSNSSSLRRAPYDATKPQQNNERRRRRRRSSSANERTNVINERTNERNKRTNERTNERTAVGHRSLYERSISLLCTYIHHLLNYIHRASTVRCHLNALIKKTYSTQIG